MEYGLTDMGFIVKPFAVIESELEEDYKSIFGNEIDVSPTSIAGAYLRNVAAKLAQLWELLGGLYAAGDINSSWSIYLDRLAYLLNVTRGAATKTTVNVALWGSSGTTIPKGHLIKDTANNSYALRESVTITSNCTGIKIHIKDIEEGTYTMSIDGLAVEYNAGENVTLAMILTNLTNSINELFPDKFDIKSMEGETAGKNDVLFIYAADVITKHQISITSDNMELVSLAVNGIYDCTVTGATYAGANTLTQIVNSIDGLDESTNYTTGVRGSDVETDDEFRVSIKTRQNNSASSDTAIENAVRKLSGVSYVRVYSNRTMETILGRPPKSFETVVDGGNDDDIANAIYSNMPAGIQPYGTTVVGVTDPKGYTWDIGFTRPTNAYLWVYVKYRRNTEETISSSVVNDIKNAIVSWCNENLEIGTDIIFQKFYMILYQLGGFSNLDIKIAITTNVIRPLDDEFVQENLPISDTWRAVADLSRIEVEEDDE